MPALRWPVLLVLLLLSVTTPAQPAPQPKALPKAQNPEGGRLAPGIQMVAIPGGTFQMGVAGNAGSRDENPLHAVTVKPFRLGAREVTVGQFRQFVKATGYQTDAENDTGGTRGCRVMDLQTGSWDYRPGRSWKDPGFAQTNEHPVVCVSHNDVRKFVAWLSQASGQKFRLPSEAEWEYAARAGTKDPYFWGVKGDAGCAFANGADTTPWPDGSRAWGKKMNCRDGHFYTAPVGSFQPNPFGLYDMLGNVWEWLEDCYHTSYAGAPTDGSAWMSGSCRLRVVRGGSWFDDPTRLRASYRDWSLPGDRGDFYGFRLAQDP